MKYELTVTVITAVVIASLFYFDPFAQIMHQKSPTSVAEGE